MIQGLKPGSGKVSLKFAYRVVQRGSLEISLSVLSTSEAQILHKNALMGTSSSPPLESLHQLRCYSHLVHFCQNLTRALLPMAPLLVSVQHNDNYMPCTAQFVTLPEIRITAAANCCCKQRCSPLAPSNLCWLVLLGATPVEEKNKQPRRLVTKADSYSCARGPKREPGRVTLQGHHEDRPAVVATAP